MFNNLNIVQLVVKWKWHLVVITGLAVVLATVFSSSFFIKPKYKSYAVIYPSNLIPYGIETPTEQMQQLLQNNRIRESVIHKFNLKAHYKIDTTKVSAQTKLNDEYDDNVVVTKTEYESVKIEVLDTRPQMAFDICNEIIRLFNSHTRNLHKEKSREVMIIDKNMLDKKGNEIDSLNEKLKELKVKYGIIDYKAQAKEASKEYYKSLAGNPKKIADLVDAIRKLEEKGGEFVEINSHIRSAFKEYRKLQTQYENDKRDMEKALTYTNEVIRPVIADKKSYPVRWVIVLASGLSTFFFSLLLIAFIEDRKKLSS